MSAHKQNPKEKAAVLTLKLRADSGYEADAEYRISAEQWGEVLGFCEGTRPVPAEKSVPDGCCIAPSTRGYARMGAGRYVLQPCLADVDGAEVPSLVIRLATEDECNRRTVGDLEDTPEEEVGVPMDENLIVCQLDFVSDMGLHALQQQLRLLRLEHFPGTSDKEHKPLNPLQAPAEQPVNARLLAIATGKIQHIYSGNCPAPMSWPGSRDPECPACQVIIAAEAQQAWPARLAARIARLTEDAVLKPHAKGD